VDTFVPSDTERLKLLFSKMGNEYVPFSNDEIAQLQTIPAILIDEQFFMIFDNMEEMTSIQNAKGLYWNYFLHSWKTFSISPFANAVLFTTLTPSITTVSISPATASAGKGTKIMLVATVNGTGFANQTVNWSVNSDKSIVTPDGQLTIGSAETKSSLTVTITSKFDATKTATATITVV
jgi:hypothetical protein